MNSEANKTYKIRKSRKVWRLIFFVGVVFIMTFVSTIIVDKFLFPYLATVKGFSKYELFKKATENVVVVNKTEQVTVTEDLTISKYSNKSAASVVEIISVMSQDGAVSKNMSNLEERQKIGSGLVVTADGLILTHEKAVIANPAKYRVFVSASNSYDARFVASDPFTGLTLLKIDNVPDLPTSSFISSEDLRVGVKVAAIGRSGNDFQVIYKAGLLTQFDPSFSLAGPIASSDKLQGVYFSDFDMNNSLDSVMNGAPVVDANGDIIGMVGSIERNNETLYFIIPVNYLKDLISKYISNGMVRRGSLGAYYLNLSAEASFAYGIGRQQGALIYSQSNQQGLAVLSGSAADKAGIRVSDIVKTVNGEEINVNHNLAVLISKYSPGDELTLGINRNGKDMDVKVILQ